MTKVEETTIHNSNSALKDILNGSIAGALGKVIEYPFDTIKVRLQTQGSVMFPTTWSCIKYTYHNEGIVRGFFQGIASPIFGASLENATLFMAYNQTSKLLERYPNVSEIQNILISGAVAGSFASLVLTPVELVKCKLQVANLENKLNKLPNAVMKNTKIFPTVVEILKAKGIFGLWQGQSSTFVRESVGGIVWFATYELLKRQFKELHPHEDNKTWELLVSGAAAGLTFNGTTFPVDTIKSITQTEHTTIKKAIVKVISKHGFSGFYRGLGITLIRAVPANATVFYTYETLSKW